MRTLVTVSTTTSQTLAIIQIATVAKSPTIAMTNPAIITIKTQKIAQPIAN